MAGGIELSGGLTAGIARRKGRKMKRERGEKRGKARKGKHQREVEAEGSEVICLIKAFATKPEYPSSISGTHTVAACHGATVHIHMCDINKYPLTSLAGFPCGSNQKLFWGTWM